MLTYVSEISTFGTAFHSPYEAIPFSPFLWYDGELREDDGSALFFFTPGAGVDPDDPPRPCSRANDLGRTFYQPEPDDKTMIKKFILLCVGVWDEGSFHASLANFRDLRLSNALSVHANCKKQIREADSVIA